MSVLVNHDMLVRAFEYAIAESRKDGIHVVDDLMDWRNNFGSRTNRITNLYGVSAHHTGSEISGSRVVNYTRSLGTGSIRPDIGRALCNTATIRSGVWPGSNDKPTIVVLAANYTNTEGKGDGNILNELKDGDVDSAGEVKPGSDTIYLNRYFLGDEGVGSYTDASQQRAFVVFYSHVLWHLGLAADADRDGRFAPIVAHRELTKRKIDPSGADMVKMRRDMEDFITQRYLGGEPREAEPLVVTTPVFNNPHTPLAVDGIWGKGTTRALQYVLKNKYNAWGIDGPLVIDGIVGRNTYRALQRLLNQEIKAGLAEDGIFGGRTKRALQQYVGASIDGIIGRDSIRKMQSKINGGF